MILTITFYVEINWCMCVFVYLRLRDRGRINGEGRPSSSVMLSELLKCLNRKWSSSCVGWYGSWCSRSWEEEDDCKTTNASSNIVPYLLKIILKPINNCLGMQKCEHVSQSRFIQEHLFLLLKDCNGKFSWNEKCHYVHTLTLFQTKCYLCSLST